MFIVYNMSSLVYLEKKQLLVLLSLGLWDWWHGAKQIWGPRAWGNDAIQCCQGLCPQGPDRSPPKPAVFFHVIEVWGQQALTMKWVTYMGCQWVVMGNRMVTRDLRASSASQERDTTVRETVHVWGCHGEFPLLILFLTEKAPWAVCSWAEGWLWGGQSLGSSGWPRTPVASGIRRSTGHLSISSALMRRHRPTGSQHVSGAGCWWHGPSTVLGMAVDEPDSGAMREPSQEMWEMEVGLGVNPPSKMCLKTEKKSFWSLFLSLSPHSTLARHHLPEIPCITEVPLIGTQRQSKSFKITKENVSFIGIMKAI